MRLYGQRFTKRFIDKRVNKRTETRDAILWDVDWNTYQARVKVQGSNEYIIAHFPRNWRKRPYWLKEGNSVRILHRQGIRGYVEIIGEGRAIPTPVEGSVYPPEETLEDMVLSGCDVSECTPPQMGVYITSGTFRLNGTVYFLTPDVTGYIIMDDPPPMTMGSGDIMGSGGYTVELDAAPSTPGHWRYDAICVGEDLVIDYIKGTESSSPEKPAIPSDHLQLGEYILVQWGATVIHDRDLGALWYESVPTALGVTISSYTGNIQEISGESYLSGELIFDFYPMNGSYYPNPECYMKVTVLDQYAEPLSCGAGGYDVSLQQIAGTGQVWSADSGYDTLVSQNWTYGSYYNFKYQRDQSVSEYSPAFLIELDYSPTIKIGSHFYLGSGEYLYAH